VRAFFSLCLIFAVAGAGRADPALDAAIGLYRNKQYPAAQAALEQVASATPADPGACYYLGMTLRHRGDDQALEAALPWLEKAVSLAPANATYLGDYGGTCLQLADKHRSFSFATRGRNAMEKAVQLDPDNLDARNGLLQFYARAPWPLGSKTRARAQADEIARRDPARGLRAFLILGRSFEKAGDRESAREAYGVALRLAPASPEVAAALARLGAAPAVGAGH
jgi:tetratricopeptide (TPR) repeat protein